MNLKTKLKIISKERLEGCTHIELSGGCVYSLMVVPHLRQHTNTQPYEVDLFCLYSKFHRQQH